MQRPSPRFRSVQFFISERRHGDVMFLVIRMGTNMAVGNQYKHLSLSFATKT